MRNKLGTDDETEAFPKFRLHYGDISNETLGETVLQDPKLLADLISSAGIKPLTLATALSKLGLASDDSFKDLLQSYTKHDSPLVREGAYQGLAEYYFNDERKHEDLPHFFKSALKEETAVGACLQISNLLHAMEMYKE